MRVWIVRLRMLFKPIMSMIEGIQASLLYVAYVAGMNFAGQINLLERDEEEEGGRMITTAVCHI